MKKNVGNLKVHGWKLFVCTLALVGFCLPQAHATLLTNGSFEAGLTDWTATPFTGGTINPFGTEGTTDGVLAAVFNGGNLLGGTLSQSFATTVGMTYQLDFDYGVFSNFFTGSSQGLQVELLGAGTLLTQNIAGLPATFPASFNSFSFGFTADSLSTTLVFSDFSTLAESFGVDGVLDDVSVTVPTAPVPEPSTMLLLGSGLIGLIACNYRRGKQTV